MKKPGSRPFGSFVTVPLSAAKLTLGALIRARMGWLLPLVIALFLTALVLGLISGLGPLAPFVYPLF